MQYLQRHLELNHGQAFEGLPAEMLFLAMTHRRLGNGERARELLAEDLPWITSSAPPTDPQGQVFMAALRGLAGEARALVLGDD